MPPGATPGMGGGLMSILADQQVVVEWIKTQPTSWVLLPAIGQLRRVKMHGLCGCAEGSLVGAHIMSGSSFLT